MRLRINKDFSVGLISVLLGLFAGGILMLFTGNDPIEGYKFLFAGGLMNLERVGNTLAMATPLILTGLSVAFAFRTGLFNIGTPGQVIIGGIVATIIGLTVQIPRPLLLSLMTIAALLSGAIWGIIPGILKARFNVHEVVSGIMMNWIAFWIAYYLIPAYFKGSFETESRHIPLTASLKVAWLSNLFSGSYINLGLFLALISVVIIAIILKETVLGYQLKAVGFNRYAAEYSGISVNSNIILAMMIAGGLSGLAGLALYTGYTTSFQIGVMPSQGFDGIAVALLGATSPIGVVGAALFFGILQSGKGFMNAMTDIPAEIGDTIIACIIYFAATSVLIQTLMDKVTKRHQKGEI
ncbi:MAG TPA: ABC transporter permease [Treponemataceae bacterium]|nr:ABC transporter permease [Treponemataceae bacterium]